jgi:hypothetical protein
MYEKLWAYHGIETSWTHDGIRFSQEHLDTVVVNRCEHCHRFDIRNDPARSFDEALERGYFVRLTAGIHYPIED